MPTWPLPPLQGLRLGQPESSIPLNKLIGLGLARDPTQPREDDSLPETRTGNGGKCRRAEAGGRWVQHCFPRGPTEPHFPQEGTLPIFTALVLLYLLFNRKLAWKGRVSPPHPRGSTLLAKTQESLWLPCAQRPRKGQPSKGQQEMKGGQWQALRETRRKITSVTKQDLMGPSWDRPLPHILCFSSSLKYLDNSI